MKGIWWDLTPVTQSSLYKIVTFSVVLLFITVSASEVCRKVNSCQCQFTNGSVINLEGLGSRGKARWQNKTAQHSDLYTYFYNPCFDFKLPENPTTESDCASGVAACQVSRNKTQPCYYNLGTQQSANFEWNPEKKSLHLTYFAVSHETRRTTNITLICDPRPDVNDSLLVIGEVPPEGQIYEMTLTSRCACADLCGPHRGLSGGSLLIILFSVFVILYLLFGIIFNKLSRGAQGWELIPNYEFWQDFPLLVRDGCVYVASGCKPDTTYERI